MNRIACVVAISVLSACGSGSGDGTRSGSTDSQSEPTTKGISLGNTSTDSSVQTLDPGEELQRLVDGQPGASSSPLVNHACGTYAFIESSGRIMVVKWSGSNWDENLPLSAAVDGDPSRVVDRFEIQDLTGDGAPEIVVRWMTPGAQRPTGAVLWASKPSCMWSPGILIDSCGPSSVVEGLSTEGQSLKASGFPAACAGRDTVYYEFKSEFEIWLSNTVRTYGRNCPPLIEYNDLPFSICSQSYFIQIAQDELRSRGFGIEVDGQLGPGSQYAILTFQSQEGLELTGLLDAATWYRLDPARGLGYPDYDGNGVVTPNEINHASGFD